MINKSTKSDLEPYVAKITSMTFVNEWAQETAADVAIALVLHALWTPPRRPCSRPPSVSPSSSSLDAGNGGGASSSATVEARSEDERHKWSACALQVAESLHSISASPAALSDEDEVLAVPARVMSICQAADRCVRLNFNVGAGVGAGIVPAPSSSSSSAAAAALQGVAEKALELDWDCEVYEPASPTATEHSISSVATAFQHPFLGLPTTVPLDLKSEEDVEDQAARIMGAILRLTPPSSMSSSTSTSASASPIEGHGSLVRPSARSQTLQACVDDLDACASRALAMDSTNSSLSINLGLYRLVGRAFQLADSSASCFLGETDEAHLAKVRTSPLCPSRGTCD
jgi:hypothetical protein